MSQGNYRRVYEALLSHPRWKPLSPAARSMWLGIKLKLGPSGIGDVYSEQLAEWSGVDSAALTNRARLELVTHGWLKVEGTTHWLVEGFANEPGRKSPNILRAVEVHLCNMRGDLVGEFRTKYASYLNRSAKGSRKGSRKAPMRLSSSSSSSSSSSKSKSSSMSSASAPDPPDLKSVSPEGQQRNTKAWAAAKAQAARIKADSNGLVAEMPEAADPGKAETVAAEIGRQKRMAAEKLAQG